ncbi:MAG: tRNA uridine-5-carboxymethylaminomethyl(34) synthesis GTPase MnmE [Eubacterium sp.]|nr:tRNA uridine-5-carboxymethylaminomethyl(34) synthesis GTPase MnmE [Eubacterium sp.]
MFNDTIAAIATAMSPSGIGIVRISGEDSVKIVDKIFEMKKKNLSFSDVPSHTVSYGFIKNGTEVVDEVMVLKMLAPNSYTKEDTVEIDCHGGTKVMQDILETVINAGARPAEPGEFTKRAFLNGRIDLSSAEAVIDLINSKTEFARKSSISQVQGSVYRKISSCREKILEQTAFIEAALDDPEHYSLDGYYEKINNIVCDLIEETEKLINSYKNGSMLQEGIQTAIVGKPNAGKSSLLNALAKKEKAIVTDIEGTTRDIIEQRVQLGNLGLNIIDTAGIRESEDIIEQIGVNKAKDIIEEADLVLYVADSSRPIDKNDEEIMSLLQDKNVIILFNKTDLEGKISEEDITGKLSKPVVSISAKEGDGIEKLEKTIEEMFALGSISFNDEIYITNERQKSSMVRALDSLKLVKEGIDNMMPEDFLSIDLLNAYEALGEITGESVGEDLINEIFSKFCMGK